MKMIETKLREWEESLAPYKESNPLLVYTARILADAVRLEHGLPLPSLDWADPTQKIMALMQMERTIATMSSWLEKHPKDCRCEKCIPIRQFFAMPPEVAEKTISH